ncbi:unnamed protein product (macronuclear) [Paramecium tetraurelia]|uniref:Chromo domain-containing protein n=1 Tax=Paramecium tetraurelia TaxID=5888 RepID=A0DY78_PARTE|nr:uncharacterized protein GSPATT00002963001 [Paramecium tetraurelia]CAK87995.1 unnamed protein product [Paramecium tetraurelia]|eukprot:XP_001455392.1 hypothetical protein (macronuclear) [Paramecium tetraurelia strain d4-2]
MQIKHPVQVLKKKVEERIEYKIQWNTGSITYEPMIELTPEMLSLVNQWELEEHYKKNSKSSEKIESKTMKIVEEQLNQMMEVEKPKLTPHKERSSEKGYVKSLRKNEGRIEFWIYIHEEGIERWVSLEEVKSRIPIALCDYLLQKIKFGGK